MNTQQVLVSNRELIYHLTKYHWRIWTATWNRKFLQQLSIHRGSVKTAEIEIFCWNSWMDLNFALPKNGSEKMGNDPKIWKKVQYIFIKARMAFRFWFNSPDGYRKTQISTESLKTLHAWCISFDFGFKMLKSHHSWCISAGLGRQVSREDSWDTNMYLMLAWWLAEEVSLGKTFENAQDSPHSWSISATLGQMRIVPVCGW